MLDSSRHLRFDTINSMLYPSNFVFYVPNTLLYILEPTFNIIE